jgi:hypothetical protein
MECQTANNTMWHDEVFFGVHYDFHARADDAQLCGELTAEHLRERWLRVRPDWVHCDCKGHPGYASWPTKVGSAAPGLKQDSLGIHREVTRELGIRLGVHYSGAWDARAIQLHPDWARRDEHGAPHPRLTCRTSGYELELMTPQLLEIVDRYEVDGFWVDGDNWASLPCWCQRCVAEFARRTGHARAPREAADPRWGEWLAFHRALFCEYVRRYTDAVHARKPGCLVCSSYMYGARQPDPQMSVPIDYLSGDLDFRWGAEHALLEARVYDARRKSWDLMAWMHTKPGEMGDHRPWMLKPLPHLCQELSEVIALGGAVMVYENPQRSGWLTGWHHDRIAQLAVFCRARQPFCFHTETVPQAAILHLADHFYRHNNILYQYEPACDPLEGALHALLQTHHSTDVLTEDAIAARLRQYPLAVIPELTGLSAALLADLTGYVRDGGHLFISGAHIARDYPRLTGATPAGDPVPAQNHLPVGDQAVPLHGAWQPVQPLPDTEVVACRLRQQEPGKDDTAQALITRRALGAGSVLAVHGPIFANYFHWPHPDLRALIGRLLDGLAIPWLARAENASPRLELVLRRNAGRLFVNLINRGPAIVLPPKRILIEELPPLVDIVLSIRRDSPPGRVSVAPTPQPLEHSWADGVLRVRVPRVDIHEVLIIE